jgi:hypothetical protein
MMRNARQACNGATMLVSFANLEMAVTFSITIMSTSTMGD